MHASHPVRSLFGPVPAGQAEHNVRSAFTTLGNTHSEHSTPNIEKVIPSQATQAERSVAGSVPAGQPTQLDCSGLLTSPGPSHSQQLSAQPLACPGSHWTHSEPSGAVTSRAMVPAGHGRSGAQPRAGLYPWLQEHSEPIRVSMASRQHVPLLYLRLQAL